MSAAVTDLAGQQDNPIREKILALLFTDRPVPPAQRPGRTRIHWTWLCRTDTENQGSRIWLSDGEPISDAEVERIRVRAQAALDPLVTRKLAQAITVAADQVDHNTIALVVTTTTSNDETFTMAVNLTRGDPSA